MKIMLVNYPLEILPVRVISYVPTSAFVLLCTDKIGLLGLLLSNIIALGAEIVVPLNLNTNVYVIVRVISVQDSRTENGVMGLLTTGSSSI